MPDDEISPEENGSEMEWNISLTPPMQGFIDTQAILDDLFMQLLSAMAIPSYIEDNQTSTTSAINENARRKWSGLPEI